MNNTQGNSSAVFKMFMQSIWLKSRKYELKGLKLLLSKHKQAYAYVGTYFSLSKVENIGKHILPITPWKAGLRALKRPFRAHAYT